MTVTCIREGVPAKYRSSTTLPFEHSGKAYEGSYYTVVNADSDIIIVIVLKLVLVVKIISTFCLYLLQLSLAVCDATIHST